MKSTEQLLELISKEINQQKYGVEPDELYEPIRYIMDLGGKRLRPLLATLSYSLFKDDVKSIIPQAIAVEVFHNFTLMHDDIMDEAPLRRNKPTVHEKWNNNTAILSGDVMLVKAYEMIMSEEHPRIMQVLKAFNRCAAEVCEGQQMDMTFETRKTVDEKEYIEMIKLKTAVLLGFSLEMGGLLADTTEENGAALRNFGINIGIGFQLKDDLLDVYADAEKFGKQVGGDIISNKKTFLLIRALELAKGKQKQELENWISKTAFDVKEKVSAVTEIYNQLKIKELTEELMNAYFIKGFESLKAVEAPLHKKAILKKFAEGLINREK
ncbi:polyprenyl synthetase family protein [Fulvivirga sediminis]|uniref:Polyprenyl synthetase family protein n=1 Tax=Fulvivirga sediminis TaxID=2803949 RepID=A0A937F4I5_9BACT|nr:polyprenyl synthetase family protein [Fulvivirga sediminis]MBL3654554.1 polyprenyl synthetase family protein [Fulvivirga sediminis]